MTLSKLVFSASLSMLLLLVCIFCNPVLGGSHTPRCPGRCSGHGVCDANGVCRCTVGYTGPDCASMTCPYGKAWAGIAAVDDDLHDQEVECSNMGTCDRVTGQCICQRPFIGPACSVMDCPPGNATDNNPTPPCNGHGKCISLKEAAETDDGIRLISTTTYTLWDAERIRGCVCNFGWTGHDCARRECVYGPDPLRASAGASEQQTFSCTGTSGTFRLKFRGIATTAISFSASTSDLKQALEALPTIEEVSVTLATGSALCDGDGQAFTITFNKQHGDLPPVSVIASSVTSISLSSSTDGTRPADECSNRGSCDESFNKGLCSCDSAWKSSDGTGGNVDGGIPDCGRLSGSSRTSCDPSSNPCNGHGVCSGNPTYRCTCFVGYTGAFCSLRTCPEGLSWWEVPLAANVGHQFAECSNRGKCERTGDNAGKCTCDQGFEGPACERLSCPLLCGTGLCLSNAQLARLNEVQGQRIPRSYGSNVGEHATWDAHKIRMCKCDLYAHTYPEHGGHTNATGGCPDRSCMYGDDPESGSGMYDNDFRNSTNEKQTIKCVGTGGSFTLSFRGETTNSIPWNAPAENTVNELSQTASVTKGSTTVTASSSVGTVLATGDIIFISNINTRTSSLANDKKLSNRLKYKVTGVSGSTITVSEKVGIATASGLKIELQQVSVKSALESLNGINTVAVSMSSVSDGESSTAACSSGGVYIEVEFQQPGNLPYLTAGASSLTSGAITVIETVPGDRESYECGNRGTCDRATGICECFEGYGASNRNQEIGTHPSCGSRVSYKLEPVGASGIPTPVESNTFEDF